LDLRANPFGNEGLRALAASPFAANLTALYLYEGGIGRAGVQALIDSPHLRGLKRLQLHARMSKEQKETLRQRFGDRLQC
jgi:hypothetical protein